MQGLVAARSGCFAEVRRLQRTLKSVLPASTFELATLQCSKGRARGSDWCGSAWAMKATSQRPNLRCSWLLRPVLAGLTGWLALMYSIQHSLVTVLHQLIGCMLADQQAWPERYPSSLEHSMSISRLSPLLSPAAEHSRHSSLISTICGSLQLQAGYTVIVLEALVAFASFRICIRFA